MMSSAPSSAPGAVPSISYGYPTLTSGPYGTPDSFSAPTVSYGGYTSSLPYSAYPTAAGVFPSSTTALGPYGTPESFSAPTVGYGGYTSSLPYSAYPTAAGVFPSSTTAPVTTIMATGELITTVHPNGEVEHTDHLDEYHKTILNANANTRVWRYQGPPEELNVPRGLGWVFPVPSMFFLEPSQRRIVDQNGVPVLHILHTFGGFKLFDFNDTVLGKTDGSRTVWCADTPSRKYALRKSFPTYYDFSIERSHKTMPLVNQATCVYRANWGALFPPICTASIMDETGDILASVTNMSGTDVNTRFQLSVRENENVLLFLLVACHMADFLVQHVADHNKTANANKEEEFANLQALDTTLERWRFLHEIKAPVPAPEIRQEPVSFLARYTAVNSASGEEQENPQELQKAVDELINPTYKPPEPKYDFLTSKYFHPLPEKDIRKRKNYF